MQTSQHDTQNVMTHNRTTQQTKQISDTNTWLRTRRNLRPATSHCQLYCIRVHRAIYGNRTLVQWHWYCINYVYVVINCYDSMWSLRVQHMCALSLSFGFLIDSYHMYQRCCVLIAASCRLSPVSVWFSK